jgi:hypothetical protein
MVMPGLMDVGEAVDEECEQREEGEKLEKPTQEDEGLPPDQTVLEKLDDRVHGVPPKMSSRLIGKWFTSLESLYS